ncbi:MotA/TolQ/ExbB proton channel family protein [Coraliomargarita akajimensis]|uniref:MotA/TolQ/ExbB proton channel n=1 Tax=Coraliomargarita akajimensis (strain DSM 45221 / IAM 15411 / JCM 23193 / KCTC 12865 / 04OKA010-24) TaxID=583355 RepID=D5EMP7_CORAD|nr:MotA/TolQ/ExbB proton channel family protein [Coraliomargarita akajimensis]ADE55287.1 MotA/TolQ/ExbB proton channel [Coraliomargarita akajimensis DSM 45221]
MQATAKTFLVLAATALALPFSNLQAQSFSDAEKQAKADLNTALKELNTVRADIAKEKIPVIREVSALEEEVRKQDAELSRLRRLRDNSESGLLRLKEQVDGIKAQNEYAAGLLDEFVRSFETRIDYSERQLYTKAAEEAKLALEDTNMTQAQRFEKQVEVIGVALDRLEQLVGGYRFDGLALAPNSDVVEGTFATFGPAVYFSAKDGSLAGIAVTKLNAAEAAVATPGPQFDSGIRQLVETGEGTIPADATLGKALKIEEGSDTIVEHLEKGGVVGYVILSLGAVCMLLGLVKVFEIGGFKTASPEQVQAVLNEIESGDKAAAAQAAGTVPGAGGDLLAAGVEHAEEKRGTLEEILYEKILACRPRLERFLPFMALTAAAAPLLGLLGTVTGMIKTFNLITIFGTGDAKSLSSGISEALVTTELGLVVAIPSLILHGLLSRMARQKMGDMEQGAVGFINGVVGSRNKDQDAA